MDEIVVLATVYSTLASVPLGKTLDEECQTVANFTALLVNLFDWDVEEATANVREVIGQQRHDAWIEKYGRAEYERQLRGFRAWF